MSATRNLEMARAAWPAPMPGWIELLATECDRSSQAAVAKRLSYSGTVVNQVLRNRYTAGLDAVESAVKGLFEGKEVVCPVLGALAAHRCQENQRAPYASTNPIRVRLYKACRAGCPHSRIKTKEPA